MSMQAQEGDETEGRFEKVIGNVVLNKWGLRAIGASSWGALAAAAGPVEVDRDEVDCTKQRCKWERPKRLLEVKQRRHPNPNTTSTSRDLT